MEREEPNDLQEWYSWLGDQRRKRQRRADRILIVQITGLILCAFSLNYLVRWLCGTS